MNTDSDIAGKVYFVGAGPSDPGLLTLKGLHVLRQAQAVIYDALIGPGIYSLIPQSAEKIPVGKRAGRHSVKQEEINRLILEQAQKGRVVVRLKGGDPFLFGRGGEELELLHTHRIPYEIVPGITSAVAVPAYAGIPVTYRGAASGVHILTGHRKQDEPLDIDFQALRQAGGTYVFLMGMSAIHEITTGFLQAGMPSDMPAAVIEQGTGARQRSVIASLSEIEEEADRQHLKAPAVIVIGETAAYGKKYTWREKLPLSKSRILVTRPAARSKRLAELLQELGAEVLEVPSIRTQSRDCAAQLSEVLSQMDAYQYLVFTSPAGVDHFFELLDRLEMDVRCIGAVKLAVIGSATGDALKKHGLRPELMPERYNSAALGKLIRESVEEGGKVLLLRSAMGSRELTEEIQAGKQIEVTDVAIYDTIYTCDTRRAGTTQEAGTTQRACCTQETGTTQRAGNTQGACTTQEAGNTQGACYIQGTSDQYIKALIENGQIDMVMFASASAVCGFVHMTEGADYTKIHAVCIGQMTANEAAAYGMQVHLSAKETIESMVEAAVELQEHRISEKKE